MDNVPQLSIKFCHASAFSKQKRQFPFQGWVSLAKAGFSYFPGWHTIHHPFTIAPNPSDRVVGNFLSKTNLFRTCFCCSFTSWAERSCCRLGSGRASPCRIARARDGNVRAVTIMSSLHSASLMTPAWASDTRLLSRVAMYQFVVRFRVRKMFVKSSTPLLVTSRQQQNDQQYGMRAALFNAFLAAPVEGAQARRPWGIQNDRKYYQKLGLFCAHKFNGSATPLNKTPLVRHHHR